MYVLNQELNLPKIFPVYIEDRPRSDQTSPSFTKFDNNVFMLTWNGSPRLRNIEFKIGALLQSHDLGIAALLKASKSSKKATINPSLNAHFPSFSILCIFLDIVAQLKTSKNSEKARSPFASNHNCQSFPSLQILVDQPQRFDFQEISRISKLFKLFTELLQNGQTLRNKIHIGVG